MRGIRIGALVALLAVATIDQQAFAAGVPVATATDEQKTAAQEAFGRALEKAKAGDHEGALKEFQASYDVVASPNTRLMIARELSSLGRLADAYREAKGAEQVANEAVAADPKYADAAKAASEEATAMAAKVGFLRVDLGDRQGELLVSGRTVPSNEVGGAIPVEPGATEVTLRSQGHNESKTVNIAAGAEGTVSFKLAAPPPPPPKEKSVHPFDGGEGQRITAYVFGGVGVVGMALFAGLGAASAAKFSDLEDQCPNNRCPASLAGDADTGASLQTGANVSLVIGAVGLAAGVGLFIPTLFQEDEEVKEARVRPVVGPGYVGLEGSF
ncbi:MAG: hypothetical protein KBA72_17540 [Thermoanaerobaculia bacterium]|nr:hypothetical protein [Thermoanaerobaculia bacterium]